MKASLAASPGSPAPNTDLCSWGNVPGKTKRKLPQDFRRGPTKVWMSQRRHCVGSRESGAFQGVLLTLTDLGIMVNLVHICTWTGHSPK